MDRLPFKPVVCLMVLLLACVPRLMHFFEFNVANNRLVKYLASGSVPPGKVESDFEEFARSSELLSHTAWEWGILKIAQGEDPQQVAALWAQSDLSTQDLVKATEFYLSRWQVKEAIAASGALQKRNPGSSCGWYYEAVLDRKQWRLAQAGKAFEKAISLDNYVDCSSVRANAYTQLGLVLLKTEDFSRARTSFEQALAIGEDIEAEVGLAETDFADGYHQASLERLQALLVEYPNRVEPWLALYKIHYASGNYEDALSAVEAAIQLSPDYNILYYYRANVHLALENYSQAAGNYQQALTKEPQNGSYYWGLARALLGLHRTDEAVVALCKVIATDPARISADALEQAQETLEQLGAQDACSTP